VRTYAGQKSLLSFSLALIVAGSVACKRGADVEEAAGASTSGAAAPAAEAVPKGKLGRNVVPTKYTLELVVAPAMERFNGRVQIKATVAEATQKVYLHGKDLNVTVVTAKAGEQSLDGRYSQVDDTGLAQLDFDAPLPAGEVTFTLTYDAPFGTHLRGLYRIEAEGRPYVFSQFEATAARQAFPCFDEPAFKTPFDVWLTIPEAHVAVSNSPIQAEDPPAGGYKRLHFKESKPLPTYLLAFAVGELDIVEAAPLPINAVRSTPIPFRGVAIKGKGPQLAYALQQTPPMVAELEDYFGIPYPYDKLDIIAVPDMGPGAMENAGAITFREWLLLVDAQSAGESQRRAFAYVMAHELAHHWFGNYVTMPWWNDIWLNEAFATWMGHRVVEKLHPDYHADTSFLSRVHHAMDSDSLVSARMVRQPVESHDDIAAAFDGITYSKGGAVLAMFEHFQGEDEFKAGIRKYLSDRPFGSATAVDLVGAVAGDSQDLKTAFASFLDQAGIPLLQAKVACKAEGNVLTVWQSRYLPAGSAGKSDRMWYMPACVRYGVGDSTAQTCTLLAAASAVVELPGQACPTWIMPNADAAGYYRWALPPEELANLRRAGFTSLTVREQLSVARSLKAGLDGGYISAADVLSSLPGLAQSSEREVATAPMAILRIARDQLVSDADRPKVEAYARELYLPLKEQLGWKERPDDTGETKLLRASVMSFLADVGRDPGTRRKAKRLGKRYLSRGPSAVPSDLRGLALRIAVEDGNEGTYASVLKAFGQATDSVVRGHLLSALSSVRDGRSVQALGLTLDPQVRTNEVMVPLRKQLGNASTREAAWGWLGRNFDSVAKRAQARSLGHLPWQSIGFCTKAHAERLKALLEPKLGQMSGGRRSLDGAIEALGLCEARATLQGKSTAQFFAGR